jgi:hypothetical protein
MKVNLEYGVAVWIKGLAAAAISGAANGVITGFAAVGIDPQRFNLQSGIKPTLTLASVSAMMSALVGTSAYLKQSPLPAPDLPPAFDDDARSRDDRAEHDPHDAHNDEHRDDHHDEQGNAHRDDGHPGDERR